MTSKELQDRTKRFAISIIKLAALLPNNPAGWIISKQIIASGTSVASNYRAVCRSKSDKDFISKMGTVLEESDETLFWLELIKEGDLYTDTPELADLIIEANALTSIFSASLKTIRKRENQPQAPNLKSKITES